MKVYRLKHKPTGLYYQPVRGKYGNQTNLSKRGKVYQTTQNALIGNGDTIIISINEKQYNTQKEIFDAMDIRDGYSNNYKIIRACKSDFEKEYITNNYD